MAWHNPSSCGLHFLAIANSRFSLIDMKGVADAPESLRVQFAEHECKDEDAHATVEEPARRTISGNAELMFSWLRATPLPSSPW
jgi:hypothetical protein